MTSGPFEKLAGKTPPAAFGLALVGAVLLPLRENRRKRPKDDFPLSYYPMFTARREKTTKVNYFVGLDGEGNRRLLPAALAGTGGLNQVRRQINRAAREGRAEELCESVARAAAEKPEYSDLRVVLFVKGSYRLPEYFAGETTPRREQVLARRKVARSGP